MDVDVNSSNVIMLPQFFYQSPQYVVPYVR